MRKIFPFFKIGMVFCVLLTLSACWVPVYLPKAERADAQPEYRTKYFVVKSPRGRYLGEKTYSSSFMVPFEGDILSEVKPETIYFTHIPSMLPIFPLKTSYALSISSYPIIEPINKMSEVKIGDKTFYQLRGCDAELWYFTPDRAYQFKGNDIWRWNKYKEKIPSKLLSVFESFEPLDLKASKEALLLEKALFLSSMEWGHGWGACYYYGKHDANFEEIMRVYQDVINENPNNYLAHLFLGIHYLTNGDSLVTDNFYRTIIAPKIKENPEEIIIGKIKWIGDAKYISTKNMEKFDFYRFNRIYIVNKRNFYSYFLHGNFDDKAAMAEFKKALEIKPDSYAARYFLSWLYLRTEEYEKAASEYKKLLEKDPNDADSLLMLSVAYNAMGLEKEARESYDELKKVTWTGTLYDFLDKFLGPALAQSLGEAIGHSIRIK